ncbi:MAG: LptF/LptG family permease [Candidatus Erginobacter occultus]|nr:LptF/LptG family permease [Candidatus Erginobacter occultus]
MKILHRYILFSVTGTFLITLLVLIGILCLGNLLKIADLILRGMNPVLILKFFGFLVISLLEYAIPMGILTAAILVFGRLSADNEITGMRACGIGLRGIISPVIFLGLVLTLICLYLQNTAIPNYGFATRRLKAQIGLQDPDALLQPGETISLPGYTINFDRKEDGYLHRVQINQYDRRELVSIIFAKKAAIELDRKKESFNLKLIDGTVEEIVDRDNPQIRTTTSFGVFNYPISLKKLYASGEVSDASKRKKDMTSGELLNRRRELLEAKYTAAKKLGIARRELSGLAEIRQTRELSAAQEWAAAALIIFPSSGFLSLPYHQNYWPGELFAAKKDTVRNIMDPMVRNLATSQTKQLAQATTKLSQKRNDFQRLSGQHLNLEKEISLHTTEFQKRLSLSAACLSMIFISIPLAIQSRRGEKTIGMVLSLALIFVFYIFIAYADAVGGEPEKFPYLIVWLPNLLFTVIGGFWMIKFTRI